MTAPANSPSATLSASAAAIFKHAAARAAASAHFGEIKVVGETLSCAAKASAAPAWYRLSFDKGRLWAEVVTADRWLSHSVEADLLHTGDKLEELFAEEVADLTDLATPPTLPPLEHFRTEDKLFTFRTPVPVSLTTPTAKDQETAAVYLLAMEACLRNLGDMHQTEE